MKRILRISAVLLCLLLVLCIGAAAADLEAVTDAAGLLTEEEIHSLGLYSLASEDNYGCGVYIVTVDDFQNYYDTVSVETAAERIYEDYHLGVGEDRNGILLLLSMSGRDFDLDAHGDIANTAFTDYGKEVLADRFLPYFASNDWYNGFLAYEKACLEFLTSAQNGHPVDVPASQQRSDDSEGRGSIFSVILLPALAALFITSVMKSKMKSVHKQTDANRYVTQNGVRLSRQMDQFTHTTETRVHIDRDSSRSGGGGTHVNSGGHSHHSGKF